MKDEVVKSVPFLQSTINDINSLSKTLGLSGNAFVRIAVQEFIKNGCKFSLDDYDVKLSSK